MQILIVEDDANLAASLVDALRHEGYKANHAPDGLTAMAMPVFTDIDLVLLDRDLPGVGGDGVCCELARTRWEC